MSTTHTAPDRTYRPGDTVRTTALPLGLDASLVADLGPVPEARGYVTATSPSGRNVEVQIPGRRVLYRWYRAEDLAPVGAS